MVNRKSRVILWIVWLLPLLTATAQQARKHFRIRWQWKEAYASLHPGDVALFDPAAYEWTPDGVYFNAQWPGEADSGNFRLENLRYVPAESSMIRFLAPLKKERHFEAGLQNLYGPGFRQISLRINALAWINGRWYRLESFDLVYQPLHGRRASVRNVAPAGHGPLSSGQIYRIETPETGVYRLDKAFLQRLGINVSQIDPRNIHILGWGGQMLPLHNNAPYPQELAEVPVYIYGEDDGRFDDSDYVLFLGFGRQNWNAESQTHNNLYGDHAYYFIRIDESPGKRITPYTEPAGPSVRTFETYYTERFHEADSFNISHMGRLWFSDNFNFGRATRHFEFSFPERAPGTPVYYRLKVATDNPVVSTMQISLNGHNVNPMQVNRLSANLRNAGMEAVVSYALDSAYVDGNDIDVYITYNDNGYSASRIFLDYIKIGVMARLQGQGESFSFMHPDQMRAGGNVTYRIDRAADIMFVWDITDPFNIKAVDNRGGQNTLSFKAPAGLHRYVAVYADAPAPEIPADKDVSRSDLHYDVFHPDGGNASPEYIIIAPDEWGKQAERLVHFHQNRGMKAFFAPLSQIYNEFGSGNPDPAAIRNFIRYVYLNAPAGQKPAYVMLLGDTSWDFKSTDVDPAENTNVIPSYQSMESFSLRTSFASDDFFVSMDDNEGYLDGSRYLPDLAVGRLTVNSLEQARKGVDKLLHYYDPETYGIWHNTVTLISDDADGPEKAWELGLLRTTLTIANILENRHPFINLKKIYLDAYKQISTSGGYRYPEAKREILNAFEHGSLIINFIGHGNEYGWTHERVLNIPEIKSLRNYDKLPFISTVTCEFGRFDNPYLVSGAEHFMNNERGGALDVVTTSREISASSGEYKNILLFRYLTGTETPRFTGFRSPGKALMLAKQHWSGVNKKIVFLGDPAMSLHFAFPEVRVTGIHGALNDTVRALDLVTVEGNVVDSTGQLLANYNGMLHIKIMDKKRQARTLNNDHVPGQDITFYRLGPVIFSGRTRVENGHFSLRFRAPLDISPRFGHGRISLYGQQQQDIRRGVDTSVVVGGINTEAPDDNRPPVIRLYMNDYNFADGGITNSEPFLLAKLYDENGINTAGGIGHDIVAVLDDRSDQTFILNDYYVADPNTYQQGKIKFKLFDLQPGEHTIKLTAWDTYNNKGTAEIRFRVVENKELEITRVLNYPNPFIDYTEFWFTHNRPYENLDVQVEVFDVAGNLVWSYWKTVNNEGNTSRDIRWNGRDDFGRPIAKGTYFYKITVRTSDGKSLTRWEKLVKL